MEREGVAKGRGVRARPAREEGLGVGGRRAADVAALGVADNNEASLVAGRHHGLISREAFGPENLEEGQLRFDRGYDVGHGIENANEEAGHVARTFLPGGFGVAHGGELLRHQGEVRVESDETGVALGEDGLVEAVGVVHGGLPLSPLGGFVAPPRLSLQGRLPPCRSLERPWIGRLSGDPQARARPQRPRAGRPLPPSCLKGPDLPPR